MAYSNSKIDTKTIHACIRYLQAGYQSIYGNCHSEYVELISQIGDRVLTRIAHGDAAYHNLEHTIAVTLVGQEILSGKCIGDRGISPQEWFHYIVSLLCHDIGYIKGACRGDRVVEQIYATGKPDQTIELSANATGASLTPYHVDRGKQFVAENLDGNSLIDIATIQTNIELTRFPVPKQDAYQDTLNYPGLARAADLIGQLSDPRYLAKIPALFQEFEETGGNKALGYQHPNDLRASYPRFYWHGVYNYVRHGIRYLELSQQGRSILDSLYHNLSIVEHELMIAAA